MYYLLSIYSIFFSLLFDTSGYGQKFYCTTLLQLKLEQIKFKVKLDGGLFKYAYMNEITSRDPPLPLLSFTERNFIERVLLIRPSFKPEINAEPLNTTFTIVQFVFPYKLTTFRSKTVNIPMLS